MKKSTKFIIGTWLACAGIYAVTCVWLSQHFEFAIEGEPDAGASVIIGIPVMVLGGLLLFTAIRGWFELLDYLEWTEGRGVPRAKVR